AEKMMRGEVKTTLPFDPFAIAQAGTDFALGLAARPADLLEIQLTAAHQLGRLLDQGDVGKCCRRPARPPLRLAAMAGRPLFPLDPRFLSARLEAIARFGVRVRGDPAQ